MTANPAHRVEPALLVILAGVVAALHVGKLPPAIPVLQEALGLTLVQAGFLLSLVQLAGMPTMFGCRDSSCRTAGAIATRVRYGIS